MFFGGRDFFRPRISVYGKEFEKMFITKYVYMVVYPSLSFPSMSPDGTKFCPGGFSLHVFSCIDGMLFTERFCTKLFGDGGVWVSLVCYSVI